MNFKEKIHKVLELNELSIGTMEDLSEFAGFHRDTIRKAIDRGSQLNKANTRTFVDKLRINPEWWYSGQEPVFIAASAENPTQVHKKAGVEENSDRQIFEAVVRAGATDYVVLPKTTLDGEYRIMPKKELEKYERQFDKIDERTQVALKAKDEVIQMKDELIKRSEEKLKEREEMILSLKKQLSGLSQKTD